MPNSIESISVTLNQLLLYYYIASNAHSWEGKWPGRKPSYNSKWIILKLLNKYPWVSSLCLNLALNNHLWATQERDELMKYHQLNHLNLKLNLGALCQQRLTIELFYRITKHLFFIDIHMMLLSQVMLHQYICIYILFSLKKVFSDVWFLEIPSLPHLFYIKLWRFLF